HLEYDFYYQAVGNYKMAYHHKSKFYELCNDESSMEYIVNSVRNFAEREFQQAEDLRHERHRRIIIYWIIGILLVLLMLFLELVRRARHNKVLNEKNIILQNQTEEILQQKEEINAQKDELQDRNDLITEKNKQITDSIHYASLIQKGALPRAEDMDSLFHDYFVIYRPLNIVAGDFYWASQVGRYSILVCADCTGHGVPGAFVSMLGISLLNEVTANISDDTKACEILDVLREKLMKSLGQSKQKYENGVIYSMDGIDMSMVMIDYANMRMQFAGAYRPLWIWRNGEILQYKPDKMPIGIYLGPEKNFTNHDIEIMKGDMLYMFSDGIPDQFGYDDDTHTTCKHFSSKRLLGLLADIGRHDLARQQQIIETTIDEWKNGYKQLDDNIMIGVRV
ncbi:MAG: SpoIIE family protein phosphatase, partial [Bacteroidales bacterium]|nr:SpoIIE family protein phosphatase [Bacteroidales bacterium]